MVQSVLLQIDVNFVYGTMSEISGEMCLQGSVFFPLPDGQGLMYCVSGTAEPPKPNGKVSRDVPCKTTFVETLAVHNWLKKSQRSVVFNGV